MRTVTDQIIYMTITEEMRLWVSTCMT